MAGHVMRPPQRGIVLANAIACRPLVFVAGVVSHAASTAPTTVRNGDTLARPNGVDYAARDLAYWSDSSLSSVKSVSASSLRTFANAFEALSTASIAFATSPPQSTHSARS